MKFLIEEVDFDTRSFQTGKEDYEVKNELETEYKGSIIEHDWLEEAEDIRDVYATLFKWFENTDWLIHKAVLRPIDVQAEFKDFFNKTHSDTESWDYEIPPLYPKGIRRSQTIEILPA